MILRCELNNLEILGFLLAAACHDLDHPCLNNIYLVNTHSRLAHRYNDKSILENHHVAVSFNLMFSCKETEIFGDLTIDEYFKIRG